MEKVAANAYENENENENDPQPQQEEEEEEGEEEKQKMIMDKFYGLIRSYREACNSLRKELELETNTKKRKYSDHIHGQRRQPITTTTAAACGTWSPSFQPQDFIFNEGLSESGTPAVARVDLIKRPALTLTLPIPIPVPPPPPAGLSFSTHNNNHNDDDDSGGLNLKLTL